jgi:hypothetical protein
MRGIEVAGLAAGALLAAALVPCAAAEFSAGRDVAAGQASAALCEPSRWLGGDASVRQVADSDSGWWVVLATAAADADVQATVQRLQACGLQPFNDFSGKFAGFRPGFQVVVDGPYATRREAEAARSAASRCAPEAYLKWARYLGE